MRQSPKRNEQRGKQKTSRAARPNRFIGGNTEGQAILKMLQGGKARPRKPA